MFHLYQMNDDGHGDLDPENISRFNKLDKYFINAIRQIKVAI